jgi:membrane associated rhomboid family serine protease
MSQPSDQGDFSLRLPRPGRGLKLVLGLILVFAILGSAFPKQIFEWMPFSPEDFREDIAAHKVPHLWTFLTSGIATAPDITHPIFALLGLYFMTPELEKRWGSTRLMRFLAISVFMGNLAVLAGSYLPFEQFHRPVMGPLAAISSTAIAWAKENQHGRAKFMFLIPMTGRTFMWLAIALAFLVLLSPGTADGVMAPLGGVVAGLLFAGTPSPARAAWLRFRLGRMRRAQAGEPYRGVTVSDLLDEETPRSRPSVKRPAKGPSLRIVQGGLEDDLKNRKPPKDKRYLN